MCLSGNSTALLADFFLHMYEIDWSCSIISRYLSNDVMNDVITSTATTLGPLVTL